MSRIVWEWELHLNIWVPYSPEVSCLLEESSQDKKDIVDLGKAEPILSCYEVSLKSMTQTRLETGTARKIRRTPYPSSHPCLQSGIVWEWCSDFGTWTAYDIETAGHLENKRWRTEFDLEGTPLGLPNKVDFIKMVQINKFTGFERPIQRRCTSALYPLDIGLSSSHASSGKSGFSQPHLSFSPIPTSTRQASGSSPSRNSPGLTTLSNQMSDLQSPSKHGSTTSPYNQMSGLQSSSKHGSTTSPYNQMAQQQLSYGAGAISGVSFGVENDKIPSKTWSSKQRDHQSYAKSQSRTQQDFSHSATSLEDENKSRKTKRKKLKPNPKQDKDALTSFCRDVLNETTDERQRLSYHQMLNSLNKIMCSYKYDCSICFEKLKDVSGFHDNSSKPPDSDIKELKKCKHRFHGTCLLEFMKSGSKNGWLQCPTCKAIHGIKHGNQPKDGTMDVSKSKHSLPGHPGYGMVTVTYNFRSGIQGKEHPHPGKHYSASGFPRVCYLPDNKKGQKVLKLLKKAWQRRLIFTVATSNTTGKDDAVVWNEIHHKTEPFANTSGHGFPDPNYLDNVLAELAVQGVDDSHDSGGDDEDTEI